MSAETSFIEKLIAVFLTSSLNCDVSPEYCHSCFVIIA
jgi:hypothetical protein